MYRKVVISPVIRGRIILTIITRSVGGLWLVVRGRIDLPTTNYQPPTRGLLTMGGNARRRPIPVGGAVPADNAHREARGHRRAGDDARAVPPLQAHLDFRATRMARPARLHARARHPADGRGNSTTAAQLSGRRSVS